MRSIEPHWLDDLGAQVLNIGGARVFDGIFLVGVVLRSHLIPAWSDDWDANVSLIGRSTWIFQGFPYKHGGSKTISAFRSLHGFTSGVYMVRTFQ